MPSKPKPRIIYTNKQPDHRDCQERFIAYFWHELSLPHKRAMLAVVKRMAKKGGKPDAA